MSRINKDICRVNLLVWLHSTLEDLKKELREINGVVSQRLSTRLIEITIPKGSDLTLHTATTVLPYEEMSESIAIKARAWYMSEKNIQRPYMNKEWDEDIDGTP